METERRAGNRHYALFVCPPKDHIRRTQAKETSLWQPNSAVSDNLHSYSSSLTAPVWEDPNSCQTTNYSLQCFLCWVFKHCLQCNLNVCFWLDWCAIHSCELTVDCMCSVPRLQQNSGIVYTCACITAVLYLFPYSGTHPCCNLRSGKVMKMWRPDWRLKWVHTETRLNALLSIPIKSELWDKWANVRNSTRIHL